MVKKRLGEILQERTPLSAEDLEAAIHEQRQTSMPLGELLLKRGLVAKEDLLLALEEVTGFQYVDCQFVAVETALLELIPRAFALSYCVLPLVREARGIVVVMAEPQNLRTIDDLKFLCGADILPRFAFRSEVNEGIERCYSTFESKKGQEPATTTPFIEQFDTSEMQFFTASPTGRNEEAIAEFEAELRNEQTPAVRLVSSVLFAAAAKRASDVHIEPQALSTVVRVRVDGVLRELTHIPTEFAHSFVSRIKILADMDIAERRLPQDGRLLVQIGKRDLDLRVSTLPTRDGEKVVIRLLDPAAIRVSFADLGLSADNSRALTRILTRPQGALLVVGPTGSGKTTTLYAALNLLRTPAVNIITVEDPIEYRIQDINQVQVNPRAGLTFTTCLRSILRQDPNVIMVGEIRDTETAEIALQATQTGHLVLSTLHTNDSVAAVTRLLDLHVPDFLIASSVSGVMAQRLVRRLCHCRMEMSLTPEYEARLLAAGVGNVPTRFYGPVGCRDCDHTGYRARVGVYELLVFDEQMRSALRSGMRDDEMRAMASSAGMKLMIEDALEKVHAGITSLEEVLRVVPVEHTSRLGCRNCGHALSPSFAYCPYCCAKRERTGNGTLPAQKPKPKQSRQLAGARR